MLEAFSIVYGSVRSNYQYGSYMYSDNGGNSSPPPGYIETSPTDMPCELSDGGRCVTDGAGPYANFESCTIRANEALAISATAFETESYYDYITVNGVRYSGNSGPVEVQMAAGDTFTWFSDGSVIREGFIICKIATPPSPPGPPASPPAPPASPPAPPSPPSPPQAPGLWEITWSSSSFVGEPACELSNGGACVTTGPFNYDNWESCSVRALASIILTSQRFATQQDYDYLTIEHRSTAPVQTAQFSGTAGPSGVHMAADDVMTWMSDGSVANAGFEVSHRILLLRSGLARWRLRGH